MCAWPCGLWQGWLQCKGMGLRSPAQPPLPLSRNQSRALYGRPSSRSMAGCTRLHLGVLPLPSTQSGGPASAPVLPSSAWQLCRPLLPAPLLCWDSAFGAAYLCFQCAGLAKPCMFLVCLLFQSCSPPALVAGSAGSWSPQRPQGWTLLKLSAMLLAQPGQPKAAAVARGNSPGGEAVCLPWATGVLAPSPWGTGQAAVSGERPQEDGACKAWELWFLQAEEPVRGFGGGSQEKWPLGLERMGGESPSTLWHSSVWVSRGCSGG